METKRKHNKLEKAYKSAGQEYGIPIPYSVREYIEEHFSGIIINEDDIEGVADAIPDYVGLINVYLKTVEPNKRKMRGAYYHDRKRIYDGSFERRLNLLSFILERVIPFPRLYNGEFLKSKGYRIPWISLSAVWNKRFQLSRMSADTMKRNYNRLRLDPLLLEAFYTSFAGDMEEGIGYFAIFLEECLSHYHFGNPLPQVIHVRETIKGFEKIIISMQNSDSITDHILNRANIAPRMETIIQHLVDCYFYPPRVNLPLKPLPEFAFLAEKNYLKDVRKVIPYIMARACAKIDERVGMERYGWEATDTTRQLLQDAFQYKVNLHNWARSQH